MDIQKLVSVLKGHKVYIQTHNFPDPDAVSSAFGLQYLLSTFDIPTTLCYDGHIDRISLQQMLNTLHIEILSREMISDMRPEDYIITVDSQATGSNRTDFIGSEIACIDHHQVFKPYAYLYEDIRIAGACASIIAQYFYESGIEMPENVATSLAYGIKMDTAEFTRGVTPLDVDMFAYTFRHCDPHMLSAFYDKILEFEDLRAYGAAIEHIELYGKTGFSFLPFACPDAMIAIVSDFILSLAEVDVAVIYSVRSTGLKYSVRSSLEEVNAGHMIHSVLADVGNGGGHRYMAGGFVPADRLPALVDDGHGLLRDRFLQYLYAIDPSITGDQSIARLLTLPNNDH